ncbi:MAG: polyphosphate kinase 1 [Oscillospiraceae bacterium]
MSEKPINSVYENREISWLKFNERVLEQSAEKNVPLMEQLLFLSIYCNNLDEFFMVRIGSLTERMLLDDGIKDSKTNLSPSRQLKKCYKRSHQLQSIKDRYFSDNENSLKDEYIIRKKPEQLSAEQSAFLYSYLKDEILPKIRIYKQDDGFPFLKNKALYLAAELSDSGAAAYAFADLSELNERVIVLPSDSKCFEYILADDAVLEYADKIFEGSKVVQKSLIRVTRSADSDLDKCYDEPTDLILATENAVEARSGLFAVRLQLSDHLSDRFIDYISYNLSLSEQQIFFEATPLDLSYYPQLSCRLKSKESLFYPPQSPKIPAAVDTERSVISQIENADILLSYPYESIQPFIKLLDEAAEGKQVTSIKITLYRLAKDSKIINALCKAAQNGKSVTVCIELRARFDEMNNIKWTEVLKSAGCRVIHGPKFYKVHSKLCVIEKSSDGKKTYITQVGTGNYNEKTAEIYTDFSLMTANPKIAQNAVEIFDSLIKGELPSPTSLLLTSPLSLRSRVVELIDREIFYTKSGGQGYFAAKLNGLSDKLIIDKLIEASQAGVKIDLIIRGICCLNAGIVGKTENIRVISIVGRYLEHSRIYIFGNDDRRTVYISSADFMTRNTCRRVEAAVPVLDETIKKRISDYFSTQLADGVNAHEQRSDGVYIKRLGDSSTDCQELFYKAASEAEALKKIPSDENNVKKKKGFFSWIKSLFRKKKK